MLFIATMLASWLAWLTFADKRRWRELFLVSLLAMALGLFTDTAMNHYRLWEYYDPHLAPLLVDMIDDCGIYIVVAYLFIQWLPQPPDRGRLVLYWLGWTALTISIECIYVTTGHMIYHKWWTTAHSYVADWSVFWLLYKFHQLFRLERLSGPQPPPEPPVR